MKPCLLIVCAVWLGGTASQALAQHRQHGGGARTHVAAAPAQPATGPTGSAGPGVATSESERDKQARLEFERGRKAFDEGDYRGAWSYFHNAYRFSGRAQLLFNIGQTADRLGHDSEALTAFRMYLERLPEADNRRDVENRIRALEVRVRDSGRVPAPPPPGSPSFEPAPETLPEAQPPAATPAAEPPWPSTVDAAPPPPPTAAEGPRPTRRGFYARVGLGAGLRRDGVSGGAEGSVTGVGFAGELAFGGTLFPGFVLGGALYSDLASSPTFEGDQGQKVDLGSAHILMIGPMADWYLSPESNGFHLQAALTFASLTVDYATAGLSVGRDAAGIGIMLGAGYDWPIAKEWALGALFRLNLATLSDDQRSHGIFAPSLVATVTWY